MWMTSDGIGNQLGFTLVHWQSRIKVYFFKPKKCRFRHIIALEIYYRTIRKKKEKAEFK